MSFGLSSVKNFALKIKDGVVNNIRTGRQTDGNEPNHKSSFRSGLSDVIQTVKNGSIAVGKQIVQTAESYMAKTINKVNVSVNFQEATYILNNMSKEVSLVYRRSRFE